MMAVMLCAALSWSEANMGGPSEREREREGAQGREGQRYGIASINDVFFFISKWRAVWIRVRVEIRCTRSQNNSRH